MQLSKIEIKLAEDLKTENNNLLKETLEIIRSNGYISLFPALIERLHSPVNEENEKLALSLLSDVKSKDAVPLIMEGLGKYTDHRLLEKLITCCWMNGQNFSGYLEYFANIVLKESYQVALEAFSVIEESIMDGNQDEISKLTNIFKSAIEKDTSDKTALYKEMLKVLTNA